MITSASSLPLASALRPKLLEEISGQDHLVGNEGIIKKIIESKRAQSLLLYGPAGCGKTTLAKLYTQAFGLEIITFNAATEGVGDLKKILKERSSFPLFSKKLIVFVDEIHRYTKPAQDSLLSHIEEGTIILIGATTENPSFWMTNALLSRMRVVWLKPLDSAALDKILVRFEKLYKPLPLTQGAREKVIKIAGGDGRHLINILEALSLSEKTLIDADTVTEQFLEKRAHLSQDTHYDLASALQKSIRGSDPDAALYWLCRLCQSGEDRLFIARRLIRIASEDVGLADPTALSITIAAKNAYEHLGMPEGDLALAQAAVYLALAPKSNALYTAFKDSLAYSEQTHHLKVPSNIITHSPTYVYDHDMAHGFSGAHYFPEEAKEFYKPKERGFEREMKKRKDFFGKLKKTLN